MKDIYVRIQTPRNNGVVIRGESRDAGHPAAQNWFEVTSYQHMIRQPKSATASTAGGHTAERCEHGDLIFSKDIDSVSPTLWQACSAGTIYADVEVDFMRANGGTRVKYLQIKLKNAIISSVTPSVLTEGLPVETFALKYASIEWQYFKQQLDGTTAPAVTGSWNLATNTTNWQTVPN